MQAGTELAGRYVLEAVLGSGAMGDVWQGTDRQLDRPVAVKVMRDRLADPRRFRREARIAARLQHPGITVVHDVGTHDGQPFIVMELLHGSDLAAVLDRAPARRLPVETAVSLIAQAASALQVAHSAHIIHRDLKPANLFRQDDGLLKICDFGVARIADATDGVITAGYAIGTALYMSPEQCESETQIDGRSDLYSLGCVLHELLTGRPPFPNGRAREVMHQHMTTPLASLRTRRPEIPEELDAIVLTMLAKKPDDRPDDADGLAATLLAFLRPGAPAAANGARPASGQVGPLASAAGNGARPAAGQGARPPAGVGQGARPAGPAPAANGESTITKDRPRPRPAPAEPPAAAPRRDRVPAAGSPSPAELQPRLQVAPLTGSWSLVAVDPLGHWLASADGDGTISLWDVASGLPIRSWSAGARVLAMAAGRGDRLAVGGDDGCARIWDVARAALGDQFRGHADGVHAVTFDHGGIRLATGDADGVVRLWDPGSRQPVTAPRPAYGAVTALAFDASGARLAAAGEDDTLRVWDVDSPHAAMLLAQRQSGEQVTAIAFGPAGQLAVGGADGRVQVWELAPPDSRWRSADHDHDGAILALTWDPEETRWISVGTDGRLRAGAGGQQPVVGYGRVRAAALSPGTGQGAAIDTSGGHIHTFRIDDPGARRDLVGSDTGLAGVAFGPSGESLVIAGADGALHVWDTKQQTLRSAGTPASGISAAAGSPDVRLAAVCLQDGSVTVYRIAAGTPALTPTLTRAWAHQRRDTASAVAFSPDGSRVATAGDAVRVWQTEDGDVGDALPDSAAHRTRAVAYDRAGRHLAATGADGAVLVWDAAKGVLLRILVRHKGIVHAAAFSPLSGQLATAGSDGTVRIWDADTGEHLHAMSGWECRARVLAFSPADGALALGCADGVVRFREPRKWTQIRAWPGHVHGITAMCFDSSGVRLATAGRDGTVRVWDPASGEAELVVLPRQERWAAAAADGTVREHGDAAGLVWFAAGLSRQAAASPTLSNELSSYLGEREPHG
jgi:WD40 repeat protein